MIALSTYYEARSRPAPHRQLRDAELKVEIEHVRKENFEVYGIEKVWRQLNREDIAVGRERVARLMREMGTHGLYKAELINRSGPWRSAEHVELATAEWVDWWNQRRLHSAADNLPPAEFERQWWEQAEAQVA